MRQMWICEDPEPEVVPRAPRGPRTWLVGEHNPFGPDQEYALYPHPPGCSGARLCRFLGLTEDEYLDRFERRNLVVTARWSARAANEAAAVLRGELVEGDRLVLLGARVARAFGYDFELLKIHRRPAGMLNQVGGILAKLPGHSVLVAPHPSGLSRAWNDRTLPGRLRVALARLEEGDPCASGS